MMEPNNNPPSERDWTEQEKDEFYTSIGLSGTPINNTPFYPNAVNAPTEPITLDYLKRTLAEFDEKFSRPNVAVPSGVNVTSITPPESGWPIVAHCNLCRKTVILLSPWAVKPEKGDYWKLEGTCLDEEDHIKHNMYPQTWAYPWPIKPVTGE
jgi:hypothetical protein